MTCTFTLFLTINNPFIIPFKQTSTLADKQKMNTNTLANPFLVYAN